MIAEAERGGRRNSWRINEKPVLVPLREEEAPGYSEGARLGAASCLQLAGRHLSKLTTKYFGNSRGEPKKYWAALQTAVVDCTRYDMTLSSLQPSKAPHEPSGKRDTKRS